MNTIYEGDPFNTAEACDSHPIDRPRVPLLLRLAAKPFGITKSTIEFLLLGLTRRFNTTDFSASSDYLYKLETVKNWTLAPCGSCYSDAPPHNPSFFDEIETHRYTTHPWLRQAINSFSISGKNVLEIGYGMGTDHLSLARQNGTLYGIDLTPRSRDLTEEHLKLNGYNSHLTVGDAELLPYENNYFDFVYSFGVVHHSPNTDQIISEIHRVLKPGGRCYIAVYHKHSLFFWWSVFLINFVVRGGYRKRTLQQQLSLIEYPNQNENMVIKLYSRSEFAALFHRFGWVQSYVRHLIPADLVILSKLFTNPNAPNPVLTRLGAKMGWYVIVEATK